MEIFPQPLSQRPFQWAVAVSVVFHLMMLASGWLRVPEAPSMAHNFGPLEVTLASPAPTLSTGREAAAAQAALVPVHRSVPIRPEHTPAPVPAAESPASPAAPGTAPASAAHQGEAAVVPPQFAVAYLNNPPPAYPALARRMRLEGETRLKVRVSAAGLPVEIQLARSSGHEVLDEAAHSAVQSWRFVPARQGTQTVEAWVVVPFKFRLAGEDALP